MSISETEALFGPLVPGRACGPCTVCCEHLVVDTAEFSKPAGTLCRYACAAGCGIYETRFEVCRDWHCLWRHMAELPESARPDRSGIMWGYAWSDGDHPRFQTAYVHGIFLTGLASLETPEAKVALDHFRTGSLPVWVSTPSGPLTRIFPTDADIADGGWETGLKRN